MIGLSPISTQPVKGPHILSVQGGLGALTQVHFTSSGHIRNRPVNARVVDEFPILLEKTTVSDFPTGLHKFRERKKGHLFRKNGATNPGWGDYLVPSYSKYPFSDMQIGNSFFLPLFELSQEEYNRVRRAVQLTMHGHIRNKHLPSLFSLASIFSVKNGAHGIAFFRVA